MTDNVIKSLEWLILNFPKQIPAKDDTDRLCNCINLYCQNAVNELKRQKAEIEEKSKKLREILPIVAELKAEAITEFAERLKGDNFKVPVDAFTSAYVLGDDDIDQIAKEMKEGW